MKILTLKTFLKLLPHILFICIQISISTPSIKINKLMFHPLGLKGRSRKEKFLILFLTQPNFKKDTKSVRKKLLSLFISIISGHLKIYYTK